MSKFQTAMRELPLVAILRGLKPSEAQAIGAVLVEAGFRLIEVPLNSPQPLESIALLRKQFPQALVGAGTALNPQDVRDVAAAYAFHLSWRPVTTPARSPWALRGILALLALALLVTTRAAAPAPGRPESPSP